MKATLEFDLPEEDYEWKRAVRCGYVEMAIDDFKRRLKRYRDDDVKFKNSYEAIERIWDDLHECFEGIEDVL